MSGWHTVFSLYAKMLSYLNKYWNKIIVSCVVSFLLYCNAAFWTVEIIYFILCSKSDGEFRFVGWIRIIESGIIKTWSCQYISSWLWPESVCVFWGLLVMTDWWAGFLNSTDWVITRKCSEQVPNWPRTLKLWESLAHESFMADSPLWSCDQSDEGSFKHLVISEMAHMCSHVLWVCGLPALLLQLLLDSCVSYLTSTQHTHVSGQFIPKNTMPPPQTPLHLFVIG